MLGEVGRQALEIEFLKPEKRTAAEKREFIRHHRPRGLSVVEGCRLMGAPPTPTLAIVNTMDEIGPVVSVKAFIDRMATTDTRIKHRGEVGVVV
jgi:hypothetical protein